MDPVAPRTHDLKTYPDPFQDIIDGKKFFEYRWNDRNFQVGDLLRLNEYTPHASCDGMYTGRVAITRVSYILHGGNYGIPSGYCIMGIKRSWMASTLYSQEYMMRRFQYACEQILNGKFD